MKKLLLILTLLYNINLWASDIEITDAKIKVLPPSSKITAVYLTIKNISNRDIHLKSVNGLFAEDFELHNMEMKNGMMIMKRVDEILIKKHSSTQLGPNALHIMVFELKSSIETGKSYELELVFSNDLKVKTKAIGTIAHGN